MDKEELVPDFDRTITDIAGLEERLQDLIGYTSTDFLEASSRDFSNKLLFWASVGVVVSTIGSLQKEQTLFGLTVVIERLFVIPLSLIAVIVFYMLALFVLGRTDYRRWSAIYRRKVADSVQVNKRLQAVMEYYLNQARRAGSEALAATNFAGPIDDEDIPLTLKNRLAELSDKCGSVSKLALSISAAGTRMQWQMKAAALLFVGAPILFGVVTCGLLIRAAILLSE